MLKFCESSTVLHQLIHLHTGWSQKFYSFFKLEQTFYNTILCLVATKGYTFQIKDGESLHRHIYCSEIKVSSVVRFILKV